MFKQKQNKRRNTNVVNSDGELNVLEDLLTEAPDQDDELYNPETERDISDKKGTHITADNTTDTTESGLIMRKNIACRVV